MYVRDEYALKMEAAHEGLLTAAKMGNMATLQQGLNDKLDINFSNDAGWTPLIWAAAADQEEAVAFLITNGANVNAANDQGTTALHQAAYLGSAQLVKLLLAGGADKSAKDENGLTALDYAKDEADGQDAVKLLE